MAERTGGAVRMRGELRARRVQPDESEPNAGEVSSPRPWVTARFDEGGGLRVTIAASGLALADDEDYRTRTCSVVIEPTDPAALASVRAALVPATGRPADEGALDAWRTRLERRRTTVLPDPEDFGELEQALRSVLETYRPVLLRYLRREIRAAESVAYREDEPGAADEEGDE